jgi:hypothetical protein
MLSLRLFRRQFTSLLSNSVKYFGAKKDGYSSSGISDKEVDKTKKPIPQGGLKSDSEKRASAPQQAKTAEPEKQTASSGSDVKIIKTVAGHRVINNNIATYY